MQKWVKYNIVLVLLAYRNTQAGLEFLGGEYGQVLYNLLIGLIAGVTTFIRDRQVGDTMWGIIHVFENAFLAVVIGNLIVFLIYLVQSKERLFQETSVRDFRNLNLSTPNINITKWDRGSPDTFAILNIENISVYPFKDSCLYIKSVKNITNPKFIFPKEERPLEWFGYHTGKLDIKEKDQKMIYVMQIENNLPHFFTIPQNPHKMEVGKYLIDLEFVAYYWWKKVNIPIRLNLACDNTGIISWNANKEIK